MGKFACVTGADRGLGLELVRQLLGQGYAVFAGRLHEQGDELDELKQQFGDFLETVKMDVGDNDSVKAACSHIAGRTESLDLLINNAAILGDIESTIFDELDFEDMLRVYNTNALGALRVTKGLIPLILKGSDRLVVNISSEAGSINDCYRTEWFAYCMSKAALNMESNLIHNILKKKGGHVLVFHPGWMRTHMRGVVDDKAPLSPGESAESIVNILLHHEKYKAEKPAFIDYTGAELHW
ncbi:MAG: SDR family oxidoreductase [Clostridia bacterium]|nr:SDR family oxidoreductase [Clostridia bacterium]